MANDQKNQGGFPENKTQGQSTHSTTGDGHPPRPGEEGYDQSKSQSSAAGQGQTGGTGGYGGTSSKSGKQ